MILFRFKFKYRRNSLFMVILFAFEKKIVKYAATFYIKVFVSFSLTKVFSEVKIKFIDQFMCGIVHRIDLIGPMNDRKIGHIFESESHSNVEKKSKYFFFHRHYKATFGLKHTLTNFFILCIANPTLFYFVEF